MKILLCGACCKNREQVEAIEALGHSVDCQQFENETTACPEIYDAVICNNLFKYNKPEKFTRLRMIQLMSAGVDEKLSAYADRNGIALRNARGVYSIPIAETVVMQILNICKNNKGFIKNQELHSWEKDRDLVELNGMTALIIGYGDIGKETAKRLKAFGVNITAANRSMKADENIDEVIPLCDICKHAPRFDIVTVSIASCKDTVGLLGKEFFESMKTGGIFVNVSRGNVIDEEALAENVKSGKLRGAAIDVMKNEPLDKNSPLWDLDGLYITPHNSFVSDRVNERMLKTMLDGLQTLEKGLKI